jgi:hypothetical protein
MPNTARTGNACENRVADYAESRGWIVGSRRHRKGGGDQLWHKPGSTPRLVECKATKRPWEHFRPEERAALVRTAREFGCDAFLALSRKAGQVSLIPERDFPAA